MRMRPGLVVCVLALAPGLAHAADDDARRRAERELEQQLGQLVPQQPARVRIDFEALDEPNYALEEATFELDGRPLPRGALDALSAEGTHLIFSGEVPAGKHVVGARVVYSSRASVLLSDEGGYSWKVSGTNTFDVPDGIEVRVRVTPSRDGSQRDVSKRIGLRLPATPVMLAKVDDGAMPPPPPRVVIDAGVPEVASSPPPAPAPEVALAPERPDDVRPDVKPGRQAAPATPARTGTRTGASQVAVAPEAPAPEAPAPETAPEPAPAPAEVAPVEAPPAQTQPADIATTAPTPAETGGLPLGLVLGGLGALAVLVLLVVVARRRSRPPTL